MSGGVTLVLGGGGFKGLAHIGVLSVLQEQGIPVERIVGSSVGSLIGGMFCALEDAARVEEIALGFVRSDAFELPKFSQTSEHATSASFMSRVVLGIKRQVAFERMFRRPSAFGATPLRFIVGSLLPHLQIEELSIPLGVCALDLGRGEEVLLSHGDLVSAVVASSAVPGFFPPVEREGSLLVDAGLVNNLPTRLARSLGAMRVVSVDLSSGLGAHRSDSVGMDVLFRVQDITTRLGNRRSADHADVVLCPELAGRNWLDASEPETLIAAGAEAARRALPEIELLLSARSGPAEPRAVG